MSTHGAPNGPPPLPAVTPYMVAEMRIRGAIELCREYGVRVRPGEVGVFRGSLTEKWMLDPTSDGVSPIGAILIGKFLESDAPNVAASDLLGVSNAWCAGVDDGVAGEQDAGRWGNAEQLYVDGWKFGVSLR